MNPLKQPGPDRVVLAGDWHGNTSRAYGVIQYAGIRNIKVVLQLGDFGYWNPGPATTDYLDTIERACAAFEVTVLWIDGNHECFPELHAQPVDPDAGLRTIRPHVHHLPRGLRWTWHDSTWMALGGASSIDKHQRTEGKSWWPDELLTTADIERAITGGPVDVIVSHDAPDRILIPGLAPNGFFPADQLATAEWHRNLLGTVVDATAPTLLFHGHYHRKYDTKRYSGDVITRVFGLADDSASLRDNITVVNFEGNAAQPAPPWPDPHRTSW